MKRCIYYFLGIALCVCLFPHKGKAMDNTTFQGIVMSKQCPTGGAEAEKLYQLGRQYRYGREVPLDKKKAEKLFNEALAMGNAKAAIQIGQMYMWDFSPLYPVDRREKYMIAMYKQSAEMGCPEAYMSLAQCYESGWGVRQDDKKADECLLKAVDMGAPKAMEFLAFYYLRQFRNEEALPLLEKSIALGNADAYMGIATLYQRAKDSTGLINALRAGARGGSKACIIRLDLVYRDSMYGQAKDKEYANKLFALYESMSDFDPPAPIPNFDKRFPPKPILPYKD